MSTTQVKNGFHGGTDDQLLVNPDGSIDVRVVGGGGGSNTNVDLYDGSGNPISSTSGSLDVYITGGSSTSPNVNLHDGSGNAINSTNGSLDVTFANGFSTLSPGSPGQISVGTSSTQLFAANALRKYAHISNNSGYLIFIQYSSAAAINQGVKIPPNGFFTIESNNLWLGSINAIGIMPSQLIDVLEGE